MRTIAALARQVALQSHASVLITGEPGSGKTVEAHALAEVCGGPWIPVNCAAVPAQLLESEFFGHEAGSFTGARYLRRGLIEAASGGTLFCDEIGEVPVHIQAKLLHVVESNQIMRVGGTRIINVNTRFMFATNSNVEQLLREGKMREDFYFRISSIRLNTIPLRERLHEIAEIAGSILTRLNTRYGHGLKTSLSDKCIRTLQEKRWPGNIRELSNVLESTYIIAHINRSREVMAEHLEAAFIITSTESTSLLTKQMEPNTSTIGNRSDNDELLKDIINRSEGNAEQAARMLINAVQFGHIRDSEIHITLRDIVAEKNLSEDFAVKIWDKVVELIPKNHFARFGRKCGTSGVAIKDWLRRRQGK